MGKYTNMPAGYDLGKNDGKDKWWQSPFFPLIPQVEFRKGNNWNADNFNFNWLWFRIWSLDHFAIEVSAEIEQTGLNIKFIIGWIRIVIRVIPTPYGWLNFLNRNPKTD